MARAAVIPPSPPRRATRARGRVASETADEQTANSSTTTKSKTKTAEPAKRGRKPGKTVTTDAPELKKRPDRKPAANNADIMDETDDEIGLETVRTEKDAAPTKARPGRPPKNTATSTRAPAEAESDDDDDDDDDELAQSDVPKRKVGRPRTKPVVKPAEAVNPEPAVKPTRGRPRTVKLSAAAADETDAETSAKKTRGRPPLKTTVAAEQKKSCIATAPTASSLAKSKPIGGAVKPKKVTFADIISDSEKENVPASSAAKGAKKSTSTSTSSSSSQTGLRAKPVRKAAAVAASGRGRPAKTTPQTAAQPLSPKKATQVAKSSSSASSEDPDDDELSGAKKSSIMLVVRSPTKHSSENMGMLSSPVKKINFTGITTPSRPAMRNENDENTTPSVQPPSALRESTFMASPARRLPGSALKETLKDTPRRGPLFIGEQSISKPEPTTPTKTSPLKASPKKGNLGASFMASPLKASSTPFKAKLSLLQSPAKRIQSPFKTMGFPMKKESEVMVDKDGMHVDASCSFQAKGSPGNVYKLSDEECKQEMNMTNKECEDDSDDVFTDSHAEMKTTCKEDDSDDVFIYSRAGTKMSIKEDDSDDVFIYSRAGTKMSIKEDDIDDVFADYPAETKMTSKEDDSDDVFTDSAAKMNMTNKEGEDDSNDVFTDSHAVKTFEHNAEEPEEPEEPLQLSNEEKQIMEEEEAVHTDQEDAQPSTEMIDDQDIEQPDAEEHDEVDEVDALIDDQNDNQENVEAPILDAAETNDGPTEAPEQKEDFVIYAEQEDESEDISSNQHCEPSRSPALSYTGQQTASPISPYEISETGETASPIHRVRSIPPAAPSPPTMPSLRYPYRDDADDEESDDELASDDSPRKQTSSPSVRCPETPASSDSMRREQASESIPGFTPLVAQLSQWKASSPDKLQRRRSQKRGIFSPVIPPQLAMKPSHQLRVRRSLAARRSLLATSVELNSESDKDDHEQETKADGVDEAVQQAAEPSIFEEPSVENRQQQNSDEVVEDREPAPADLEVQEEDEEEYGDENVAPPEEAVRSESVAPDDDMSEANEESQESQRQPMSITPVRINRDAYRTIHTVSKVPLKPEGAVSPLKMPRKRSRSLSSGPTTPTRSSPRRRANMLTRSNTSPSPSPGKSGHALEVLDPEDVPTDTEVEGRQSKPSSITASPVKTPRRNITAGDQVLRGAVVFVDVYTTEGEDASGIFIELLTQMGARCVKTWSWNPRSSQSPVGGADPKESKVGITHVVYKDGGIRTLEKVRQAGDLVKCVGVGWVLDCERENKWLDESHYLVDCSIIPRGGAKRRKSMEPRALSNINGSLTSSGNSRRSRVPADWETMEEFMRLSPNTSPNLGGLTSTAAESSSHPILHPPKTPKTPNSSSSYDFNNLNFDFTGMSPATPYYLSQRAKLVQQTCPPKQTNKGLFSPLNRKKSDDDDFDDDGPGAINLRVKLEAARRKSLVFKPRVGSPLGR
ncbi:hypothetical protein VTN77DRAFT_6761 [Rasamsonia byssochlamydoides]|uniref:uncharacterized protein n=1 Tax=Rasamsonia byssochlamydoides TaxID=89139 RepID=UPI0037442757